MISLIIIKLVSPIMIQLHQDHDHGAHGADSEPTAGAEIGLPSLIIMRKITKKGQGGNQAPWQESTEPEVTGTKYREDLSVGPKPGVESGDGENRLISMNRV